MIVRARLAAVLAATVLAVLVLSGCVGISSTATSQPKSMGPVTLSVSACSSGSPGCKAVSNSGSVYELIGAESVTSQLLLAVRLPDGPTPPSSLTASLAGGGTLAFSRSVSYEQQLQALEPAPAGERWWGWLSASFTYSQGSKQGFSVAFAVDPPSLPEGPAPSPMRWRPVVGVRGVEGDLPATRPVVCGSTTADLYEGINEEGPSVSDSIVCIDSPDEAATRGFIGAPIVDFGITGTAVTASAGSSLTATFLARRSGNPDPATTFSLSATTAIPGGSVAIDRSEVSLGGDSTQPVLATVTVPPGTAPGSYPVTVTATAPGKPTRTGTTTVTVPGRAPTLSAKLNRTRFRGGTIKGRVEGLPPVGATLTLRSSSASRLTAIVQRKGRKGFKQVKRARRELRAGKTTIAIGKRAFGVKLAPGRYRLKLTARADGLDSPTRTVAFTFLAG